MPAEFRKFTLFFRLAITVNLLFSATPQNHSDSINKTIHNDSSNLEQLFGNETATESSLASEPVTDSGVGVTIDLPLYGGLLVEDNSNRVYDQLLKANMQQYIKKTNETLAEIKNKVLRVVSVLEPPFVNYLNLSDEAARNHTSGPGVVIELLRVFEQVYNVQFEFIDTNETRWGEPTATPGQWDGLIGMLQRDEADVLGGAAIVRYDRHEVVDFSYPFYSTETSLLIRSPARYISDRFLIVTAAFHMYLWLMTAAAVIVSGFILRGLARALTGATEVQYSQWSATWVFFSVFVQQGLPELPKTWTCRTLLSFWWLAALTLVATFTGNMVALFSLNKQRMPFYTFDQFVEKVRSSDYKVVTSTDSLTRIKFLKSSEVASYQKLWREMTTNGKWINVSNLAEGVQLVKKTPKLALVGAKETLQALEAKECAVVVAPVGLIPVMYSITLRKHSNFTTLFSNHARELVEMGFITKWMNDYESALATERGKLCANDQGVTAAGDAIDIGRAQGAFWILIGGVVIACGGLAAEYALRIIRKAREVIAHEIHEHRHHHDHDHHDAKSSQDQDASGWHTGSRRHRFYSRDRPIGDPNAHLESARDYQPFTGVFGRVPSDKSPDYDLKQRKKVEVVRF